uniref:RNase H type-1 domain-containing protein n=1 Tax=Brassica oleracea TaxID=3712 RepID=A0A3P6FD22_BRAOL|nr:unnamed protein product [Brassica oleracea]
MPTGLTSMSIIINTIKLSNFPYIENDKLFRGIDRDPLELVRYAESERQLDSMGKIQLMGTRNLMRRETALHSELEALKWTMESMLQHSTCQRFETDCKDLIAMITDPQVWPNFSTELEVIQTLQISFSDFKISYFPRTQDKIADSLVRNACCFHRSFCFIGCFIPVWITRTPQV